MTKLSKLAQKRSEALDQLAELERMVNGPARELIPFIRETLEELGPTSFSEWLRKQPELDSEYGYNTSDIDFMWQKWKGPNSPKWMLIEEKCHNAKCYLAQKNLFEIIDKASKNDPNYQGFFYIRFENTSPDDGKIWLNGKLITKDQFINFLRFLP